MKKHSTDTAARRKRRRTVFLTVAGILTVFVLVNMAIIYHFSAESVEESGNRSTGLTEFVTKLVWPGYDELSYPDQLKAQEKLHSPIRKAAHFSEYALLGFLTASLLLHLSRRPRKRPIKAWMTWVFPAGFCLIYAISDEVHQIFSNRGPSVWDVMIDFAGALFGILLIQCIVRLSRRNRKKREKRHADHALRSVDT